MVSENEFRLSCPRCYSGEHEAYRLRVGSMDLGTPYGEALRHCVGCGIKFHVRNGVELCLLAPTTAFHEQLARMIQQEVGPNV